ncbi:hypothetical protein BDR04DRAFT_1105598 [Suillus decipiens]|nr:hypothetical protein BDR04DRAFT_1105598 [Suillus decipiens]
MARQLTSMTDKCFADRGIYYPTTISLTIHVCVVLMAQHSAFYCPSHRMLLEYDDTTFKA